MIPQVLNRTSVLILQHRRERTHPFNTARIVRQSLDQCELMAAHNPELAEQFGAMELSEKVGLLYPGDDAKLLTEVAAEDRPEQLVVVDGTWHHAKTLMRDIPRLRALSRYRLAPTSPGRYTIRREPNEHALSTLEATVAALKAIEPETLGLDRLMDVFERMIADQLGCKKSNWRRNERRHRGAPNIPRLLTGDLKNIVVAYGEQEKGNKAVRSKEDRRRATPVYWTAIRLVDGEKFQCAIESDSLHDAVFMDRLKLQPMEIESPVSLDEFRSQWHRFLHADDTVVVFHRSTARLLENVSADFSPTLILKSISGVGADESGEIETDTDSESRPSRRLSSATRIVERLNAKYRRDSQAIEI